MGWSPCSTISPATAPPTWCRGPWYPRAVVMTWFDGALHSRLAQLTRLSPSAIQDTAYDVVAEGGAGEAARRDEQARRDREEDRRTALLEILSARALREIGISVDALAGGGITREQLEAACARHGLHPHDLAGTLEAFTTTLMPVGASGVLDGTLEGPLRLTLRQLRQLSAHLKCREQHAERDDRDRYALAHRAAEAAVTLAERILARLDAQIAHVAASLAGWARLEPEMARWIFQLELILDGWPQVIAFHAGTIDPPAGTRELRMPPFWRPSCQDWRRSWSGQGRQAHLSCDMKTFVRNNRPGKCRARRSSEPVTLPTKWPTASRRIS